VGGSVTKIWHTTRVSETPEASISIDPDEVLSPGVDASTSETDQLEESDFISQPAKVMRLGAMVKSLLDEARTAPLDEPGRRRLKEIHDTTLHELADSLSRDLADELDRMVPSFSAEVPSDSELRLAQAQLVGWLEGLFHGIQASLFAQQAAAAAQLEKARDRSLAAAPERPGTYL